MSHRHRSAVVAAALALLPAALAACAATEAQSAAGAGAVQVDAAPAADGDARLDAALARAERDIQAIVAVPDGRRTYANTLGAMDDLLARLYEAVWVDAFLANVHPDAAVRDRGERIRERLGDWSVEFSKRRDLYEAIKAYADSKPELDPERARLLEFTMRDYRRAGMDLPPAELERLTEIEKEESKLSIEFQKNIRDDDTTLLLTAAELEGCPADFLAGLDRSGELYVITMRGPIWGPIFDHCSVPATRQKLSFALRRRAPQNVAVLERLIALRQEQAQILGYATTADFVTETRMAKSAANVQAFYDELRPKLRRKALQDLEEYTAAKRADTGDPNAKLESWDRSYYEQELLRTKYHVDSEKVREYFPLQACLDGLFAITQTIYGLEYADVTAQAPARWPAIWHEDVRLYEVSDRATGELLGAFFLDLHPRPNKYNHAAKFGLRGRKVWPDGSVTLPVCALVCNFTKPTADKPSLMTHDEVETLFHEFGHCLHHILTRAETYAFEGTSVARDFVEAPSQMFEEWIWDADVLASFARHYKTGEAIPAELVEGMVAARHMGSGMNTESQVFLGLMDLRFHTDPDGQVDTTRVLMDTYRETTLFEPMDHTYSQAAFGHMVGYQAGYYGYLWSLVYAADMASRFKAEGLLNPATGREYRAKVLAPGGSRDELDMVRDFLGRDPRPDAFLESLGLNES